MGPTGHSAQRHVRKRNILLQISQKDLDIVTTAANCCPSKVHPLESSNDSAISAPKHICTLTKWHPCVMCPPPRGASALSTPAQIHGIRSGTTGLSPPHGSCGRTAPSAIDNARAWLSRPVFLITANTHSRAREPAKSSRCTTHAPGRRHCRTGDAHPSTGGAAFGFVSVHVSLRQKAWDSRRVGRSRCCAVGSLSVGDEPIAPVFVPVTLYPM